MKRLLLLLLLLASPGFAWNLGGDGNSLDGMFSGGAPASMASQWPPISEGIHSYFFRGGLVAEFLPGNWHLNGGKIDIWYDTSPKGGFNAVMPTTIYQPIPVNGNVFFDGSSYMNFPQYSGNINLVIMKIRLASTTTPTDFENEMYLLGKNAPENVLIGFDHNTYYAARRPLRWYGTPGINTDAPLASDPMTIGLYGSPNLNLFRSYTQYSGVATLPCDPNIAYSPTPMQFSKIGAYGASGANRAYKGEIIALWFWDRDNGIQDFADLASIAFQYNP